MEYIETPTHVSNVSVVYPPFSGNSVILNREEYANELKNELKVEVKADVTQKMKTM